MTTHRFIWEVLCWVPRFLAYVVAIVGLGGVIGTILFPVVGLLLGMDYPVSHMALKGLHDGSFFFGVWAPGVSFVACVIQAHNRNRESDPTCGKQLSNQ